MNFIKKAMLDGYNNYFDIKITLIDKADYDIVTELEFQHDFAHECDIDSDRYNCWLVGSECDYRNLYDTTIVERIDVDMNVRYVK